MGRLTGTSTQYSFVPSRTFTNAYSYDAASNRTGYTDPESGTVSYVYDTLNRLSTLTSSFAGQFGFGYDTLSRRTSLARPNGVNTSYTYDSLSRLLSVLHQVGANTVDGASYTLDNAGNRLSKTNYLNSTTENYAYDAIYQLKQVTQGANTTESYTYDLVGNRLSSLNVPSYTYNSSNQLTASADGKSYTYDNNGNTTSKTDGSGTTQYTWDYENRLTSVVLPGSGGTVTFKYDPFGRRIQKVSSAGTTAYVYDGANSIEEVDSAGTVLARYAQGAGIDEPLAQLRSSTTSFYEADGLGSITSLSDSSAAVASSYTYDTFGNAVSATGTVVNPYHYTARDYDSETGVYYLRARYYDKITGRFLNEDLIGFNGGINFYRYVHNSPVLLFDPLGLAGQADHSHPPAGCHFPSCFWFYGNWGGPGWSGGQWSPIENLSPEQQTQLAPPIDEQDSCYRAHDYCYSRARVRNNCEINGPKNKQQIKDEGTCDFQLVHCLQNAPNRVKDWHVILAEPLFGLAGTWAGGTNR